MNNLMLEVLERAVQLVLSRSGDVDTENGSFATVCTDEVIRLETAIAEAFELDSDDVNESDIPYICETIKSLKLES